MKKYIHYILYTLLCRFSSCFNLHNATVRWIIYHLSPSSKINIDSSKWIKSSISSFGENNEVSIMGEADLVYSNIAICGNNNRVVLNGCTGILSLIIRGNNCHVVIGRKTSMEQCYMVCMGQGNSIIIGDDCMFSGGVEIWNSDTHLITNLDGSPINKSLPINIGNHIWLGKYAKVLKGVTIGDSSIVGMNSVVTKNIPTHSVSAGNPAKIVKEAVDWKKGFIEI
ncbi:acyltransferase [Bacteroides difficilis]|uniref:acyltransferase n=1 Tax=Bacteroides difficilis TaxID=2763021 RepID=UPI003AAA9F48